MAINPYSPPQDRQATNDGYLVDEWDSFFNSIGFVQSAAIPDLPASPSTADIRSAVQAILTVLRSQNRIAKS